MAAPRSFLLLDISGVPLTTATPTFVDYRDKAGNTRVQPAAPTHLGGGEYAFTPSDSDETVGTVALVDGGVNAYPRRHTFALYRDDGQNQFFAWHLEDQAGELWTGVAPTIGQYVSAAGAVLPSPTVATVAGAYLYAVTPTASDLATLVVARLDSPPDSAAAYFHAATTTAAPYVAPATPTPGVNPETIAVANLVQYLRLKLPTKLAEINATRAARLTTPGVGTGTQAGWTVPTGATLTIAPGRGAAATTVALPTGAAVSASAISTALNAAPVTGVTASVDFEGRVVLTSNTAPTSSDSVIELRPDSSGGNAALGWDRGGELVASSYISAPTWRSVMDGYPVAAPDAKAGMWVIVGDRESRPWPSPGADIRRNETDVSVILEVFRPEANKYPHRSREAIQACVRAVREVLQSDDGRMLGRGQVRDIVRVDITGVRISGRPFSFTNRESPNVLCDVAAISLVIRVHQATS